MKKNLYIDTHTTILSIQNCSTKEQIKPMAFPKELSDKASERKKVSESIKWLALGNSERHTNKRNGKNRRKMLSE